MQKPPPPWMRPFLALRVAVSTIPEGPDVLLIKGLQWLGLNLSSSRMATYLTISNPFELSIACGWEHLHSAGVFFFWPSSSLSISHLCQKCT